MTVPTGGADGHGAVIERMIDGVRALLAENAAIHVTGIGIGFLVRSTWRPGSPATCRTCPDAGEVVPVGPAIADATGLPVGMINDAKAFALAEYRLGAAAGAGTALCVTVGTGIGGAVIAHGQSCTGWALWPARSGI